MRRFTVLVERLARGLIWVNNVFISAMVIIICAEIIARYALNTSLGWPFEVTEYLMVPVVFFSAAYVLTRRRHLAVDIMFNRLSLRTQAVLEILISIISLLWFLAIVKAGWDAAYAAWDMGLRSPTGTPLPLFPVRITIPIGASVMSLALVVKLLGDVQALYRTLHIKN